MAKRGSLPKFAVVLFVLILCFLEYGRSTEMDEAVDLPSMGNHKTLGEDIYPVYRNPQSFQFDDSEVVEEDIKK